MKYFLDCEFFDLKGDIISLALVSETRWGVPGAQYGNELYLAYDQKELEAEAKIVTLTEDRAWVREHVLPIIDAPQATAERVGTCRADLKAAMAHRIATFLKGDPEPIIIADWVADIRYFSEIMNSASLWWEQDGGAMASLPTLTFIAEKVDAYPTDYPGAVQHNALWDARALRHKLMALA